MKIIAGTLHSILVGARPEIVDKLDKELAIMIPGVQYSPRFKLLKGKWDGKARLFNKKSGKFPTGLLRKALAITGAELEDHRFDGYEDVWEKAKADARDLRLLGTEDRDSQRKAITNSVDEGRCTVLGATNFGKSEICCGLAASFNLPTLWLVNRKGLLKQCADRWEERTGTKAGMVGDGEYSIGAIMTVGMVQTIHAMKDAKQFLSQFKVLLVDEAAHASSFTWYDVCMACPAPFRFALTGTAPKIRLRLYRMMAATDCTLGYKITNQEMIDLGYSAKPIMHIQPLNYHENNFSYRLAYNSMIRFNKRYASVVAEEAKAWYDKGKIILIIVDRMAQGMHISSELAGRGVRAKFINGGTDSEIREKVKAEFKKGITPVVIATSIFDEGEDVPAINVLILAAGGKAEGRQLQRVGRGLRKKDGENTVDIIDYVHNGNAYLLQHSLERIDIYQQQGFELSWRDAIKI